MGGASEAIVMPYSSSPKFLINYGNGETHEYN
jgi:hypothetical protein